MWNIFWNLLTAAGMFYNSWYFYHHGKEDVGFVSLMIAMIYLQLAGKKDK